jgi:23S rRNA (guanosine2251-2'-O)-methyltransferase
VADDDTGPGSNRTNTPFGKGVPRQAERREGGEDAPRHKRTDRGVRRWEKHARNKAETRGRAEALSLRKGEAGADIVVLYGVHPVVEALRNPARKPLRLLATENAARRLLEDVPDHSIRPIIVSPAEIDALLTPDAVHQGLYLEAAPLPAPDLGAIGAQDVLLVLDQITDPHNVGAILRTAAAFGVSAVIVTQRHSPSVTGVLAKAASGALEHVPMVAVRNLGDTLGHLAEQGVTVVGFDSEGASALETVPLTRPLALVMGAEGKGLRQRTRDLCQVLARLDMPGSIKSLNVSNATAIALYAVTRQGG